jgi:hypothetical protein
MNYDINLSDLISELRNNDGEMLRRLLHLLRQDEDPEAKGLYATLVQHPDLYDLVPN